MDDRGRNDDGPRVGRISFFLFLEMILRQVMLVFVVVIVVDEYIK